MFLSKENCRYRILQLMSILVLYCMPDNTFAFDKGDQNIFVATIYPVAAIVKEIVGDQYQVETLLSPSSSPHTFEPKPSDLHKLERALALIYVGANLDKEWIGKLPAKNKIELLSLISSEKKLFMTADSHHHCEHDEHHDDHGEKNAVDPHFWTDPLLVKSMLDQLVDSLIQIVPEHADLYKKNALFFVQKLDQLNDEITKLVDPVKEQPILLFHPSFNYFVKRYDLFLAGIIEPAPGKEPSPKFIHQTLKKMRSVQAKALFGEIQSSKNSLQVLAEAAEVEIYELDPIGGVPGRESYLDLLMYNAKILAKGLQGSQ